MVAFDITERIVSFLGVPTGTGGSVWSNSDFEWDYAIGGIPFLSAANDRTPYLRAPYQRGLAQIRREQVDQQPTPGEQSLSGWWLRSQANFTGGAGVKFLEPTSNDRVMRRFRDSLGVDCWTAGELSLLRNATAADATGVAGQAWTVSSGSSAFFIYGSTSPKISRSGTLTALTGTGLPLAVTDDGVNFYRLTQSGLYKGLIASGGDAAYYTVSCSSGALAFVKGRLMLAADRVLYELTGAGAPALPSALYTHPTTGWRWTSICDGPTAIYAAGYAGNKSSIYKFTIDNAGSLPTVTGGTVVAELPTGETINHIVSYLGRYLGVSTSKGFRVASIDGNGDLTYGPLIWTDAACYTALGDDRFFFVGTTLSSGPGLIRVDLSDPDTDGRFPYATDLQAYTSSGAAALGGTGWVSAVTALGATGLKALCTFDSTQSFFVTEQTSLIPSGWWRSGQVRYSTLEPKHFQLVNVRWETPLPGSIAISAINSSLAESSIITVDSAVESTDFAMPSDPNALAYGIRFDLYRDAVDATTGPTVQGWQFKAVPATTRRELIQIPLICFDFQRDKYDAQLGYEGFALDRYSLLRDTIRNGMHVTFQDLSMGESLQVVVEDMQFEQMAPPGIQSGFGGVLTVNLREL